MYCYIVFVFTQTLDIVPLDIVLHKKNSKLPNNYTTLKFKEKPVTYANMCFLYHADIISTITNSQCYRFLR